MTNDDRPPVRKKPEGILKKKIDTDEYWVSAPTILIILVVAVSIVIYASFKSYSKESCWSNF